MRGVYFCFYGQCCQKLHLCACLFLLPAHAASQDFVYTSPSMLSCSAPESLLIFLLLGLTFILSGGAYLWLLRYVCTGCFQPIVATDDGDFLERIA